MIIRRMISRARSMAGKLSGFTNKLTSRRTKKIYPRIIRNVICRNHGAPPFESQEALPRYEPEGGCAERLRCVEMARQPVQLKGNDSFKRLTTEFGPGRAGAIVVLFHCVATLPFGKSRLTPRCSA